MNSTPIFCEELTHPPLWVDVFAENPDDPLVAPLTEAVQTLLPMFLSEALSEGIPGAVNLQDSGQTWQVELYWVGNPTIQALNFEHRGKDAPTDVLSFTLFADSPARAVMAQLEEVTLGSIFVSLDWARQQVDGNPEKNDVLYIYTLERVVHGLLHLMGVNHDTEREYNRVVTFQQRVLQQYAQT